MNIFLKKFLLTLLLWGSLGFHQIQANTVDSLFQVLETCPKDTNRVNLLDNLCKQLSRIDIDKVFDLTNESLALSEELNYKKGIGQSYIHFTFFNIAKGDYEQALAFANKALDIAQEIGNDDIYGSACNFIAGIYSDTGEPEKALKIWQDLIDFDKKKGKSTAGEQVITYLNMASVLVKNDNNKEAKRYYMLALETAKHTDEARIKSAVQLSVAKMYLREGDTEKAESHFTEAYRVSEASGDLRVSANATFGLSNINLEKGNKEFAVMQAKDAVKKIEQIGITSLTITAKRELSTILRSVGRYEEALQLGLHLVELVEKSELILKQIKVYSELSLTYKMLEDYEQAFIFSEKYHAFQDSISLLEKEKSIIELEKKYHSELKENENKALKIEKEKQELQLTQKSYLTNSLFFILVLLGVVCFMIYKNYKEKLSAQLHLEETVRERTEELRLSNNNLQKSNVELERFAHIASHDLREPLRNISGFAGLLKRELKPQKNSNIDEYLSFIINNTTQLSTLIQDILTYSKLNTEKEKLISVNPNNIINDINKTLAHSISQRKVKIFVKGQLPIINNNGQQVYFLFKNLIDNGIKYNKSAFPRIDISCAEKGDNYEFSVRDNGIGIAPDFTSKIFEMFTRLHNRQHFKGTGLGLSLCQKIVENHGGTIRVESTEGQGSNFIFTWPKALTSINDIPNKKEDNAFVLS